MRATAALDASTGPAISGTARSNTGFVCRGHGPLPHTGIRSGNAN